MNTKVIFYIVLAVLLTLIAANNRQEVPFWLFGDRSVSLLLLLAFGCVMGFIIGIVISRPRKAPPEIEDDGIIDDDEEEDTLDEEDRDYIS